VPLEVTIQHWRSGEQQLLGAPPEHRQVLDRIADAIHAELRRKLGGPFTVAELVALYDSGVSWCTDIAYEIAPGLPAVWDPRLTADPAFGRYVRGATDYAGGKTTEL
jgi:hypothetical protein